MRAEESEVEVTRAQGGRRRVFPCLSQERERIGINAVASHLQMQHLHMRIHMEEFVHIVGELHGAIGTCRQHILAETHALHISIRQIQIQHTLHQVPFQRAVKRQVCLHLLVVCCQCQLQLASLQRGIRIHVAEVELAHIGIRQTGCGIERGGRRKEVKATPIHLCLTRQHGAVIQCHIVVHHQIAERHICPVCICPHHITTIQIHRSTIRIFGFQFRLQRKVICHIPKSDLAIHNSLARHFQVQLRHIKRLEISLCTQLQLHRAHRQFPVQHRTRILRVGTSHTGEIHHIALSYLSFAHQRENTRVHIVKGIHVHAISKRQVTVARLHMKLRNSQRKRIHHHPALHLRDGQS